MRERDRREKKEGRERLRTVFISIAGAISHEAYLVFLELLDRNETKNALKEVNRRNTIVSGFYLQILCPPLHLKFVLMF